MCPQSPFHEIRLLQCLLPAPDKCCFHDCSCSMSKRVCCILIFTALTSSSILASLSMLWRTLRVAAGFLCRDKQTLLVVFFACMICISLFMVCIAENCLPSRCCTKWWRLWNLGCNWTLTAPEGRQWGQTAQWSGHILVCTNCATCS